MKIAAATSTGQQISRLRVAAVRLRGRAAETLPVVILSAGRALGVGDRRQEVVVRPRV